MGDQTSNPTGSLAAEEPASPPDSKRELRAFLKRAVKGDESTLPRLRELIRADPELMIRVCYGDLARRAEDVAIGRMAGKNLATAEAIRTKLELLRAELAGPDAPPIERLLAERAALCWLDCHIWEIHHDTADTQSRKGLLWSQHEQYQRMRDRAHRRYLQALKALAQVRKLGPAIQVNLARNQVNVASPVAPPDGSGGRNLPPPAP